MSDVLFIVIQFSFVVLSTGLGLPDIYGVYMPFDILPLFK